MIYTASDIHGCFEKYRKLLDRISLGPEDTLYLLGDYVDRGPDGVGVLRDLMNRKNVVPLMGNHDRLTCSILGLWEGPENKDRDELIGLWFRDGGESTCRGLLALGREERETLRVFLGKLPLWKEVTVNGRKYFLSHALPAKNAVRKLTACRPDDYLWGETDYSEVYFDDVTLVTGHVPTGLIDPAFTGRIFRGNNHIAVDCGACFGKPMGCVCLDSGEEFYVE